MGYCIDGIRLVTETEGKVKPSIYELKFKDAVEGFHSYIYRDELPIDRQDLLDNIKMLENLSRENTQIDLSLMLCSWKNWKSPLIQRN